MRIKFLTSLLRFSAKQKFADSRPIMGIKGNVSTNSPEMREMAARICRNYLTGSWKKISSHNIILKRISGGMSNWLYQVTLPDSFKSRSSEPSHVLLRLYGQLHGEQALENLVIESVIFTLLSERQLGPKLHGVFPGGRLEEYIPARPLKTLELSNPTLSSLIAEKTAQVHGMDIPINKEPFWMWDHLNRWTENIEKNFRSSDSGKVCERIKSSNFTSEIEWLRKYLKKVGSPVVFCHNDLQEGNILLCDNGSESHDPRLVLIDFEYCAYNYRAFDIANHFLEWTYDYTNPEYPYFSVEKSQYPSKSQQRLFLRKYLQTWSQEHSHSSRSIEEEMEILTKEVEAFTLASHFFWSLWALVNSRVSEIPFGYWEYAIERLDSYFNLKKKILGAEKKDVLDGHTIDNGLKRKIEDIEV